MISISVASPQEIVPPDYLKLKTAARAVLEGEGIKEAKISLALVDDATITSINERFLKHEGPTDVITFPWSNPKAKKLEGEIVMGVEVALRESEERGHNIHDELCLYVIHGALHLCGYDDHDDEDAAEMRRKERIYLKKLELPDIA
jgi:probable rRNA maturation factor